MKRLMIYKILGIGAFMVLVFVSLGFVSTEKAKIECTGIDYLFDKAYQFISTETIDMAVASHFKGLKGAIIDTIDTEMLELEIEKLAWVHNAEVFKGYGLSDTTRFTGKLKVYVEQEEPVLRVVNGATAYYVSREGKKMPISLLHSVNVPVITGVVNDQLLNDELLVLIQKISEDYFLSSLFQQIDVQKNGELILIPRIGNHVIEFGTIDKMDLKFRNLEVFYKKGLKNGKWNNYKNINLKYNNQVVCTLR